MNSDQESKSEDNYDPYQEGEEAMKEFIKNTHGIYSQKNIKKKLKKAMKIPKKYIIHNKPVLSDSQQSSSRSSTPLDRNEENSNEE